MKTTMKCSNCGAEVSNLTMVHGKKQWLWMLPIMLFSFYPIMRMSFLKPDHTEHLAIKDAVRVNADRDIRITGRIENSGNKTWSGITVEAEFYAPDGRFLDEESVYLRSEVSPKGNENFSISMRPSSEALRAPETKMIVKVSSARTDPF